MFLIFVFLNQAVFVCVFHSSLILTHCLLLNNTKFKRYINSYCGNVLTRTCKHEASHTNINYCSGGSQTFVHRFLHICIVYYIVYIENYLQIWYTTYISCNPNPNPKCSIFKSCTVYNDVPCTILMYYYKMCVICPKDSIKNYCTTTISMNILFLVITLPRPMAPPLPPLSCIWVSSHRQAECAAESSQSVQSLTGLFLIVSQFNVQPIFILSVVSMT